MAYNNILVTLDGSKLSEVAVRAATEIAKPGANIYLLSVLSSDRPSEIAALSSAQPYPAPATEWPPMGGITDPHTENAHEKYLHGISEWLSQADFKVTVDAREGEVIETILQMARGGYDLIVMATHGHTGQTKIILGSVAEAVLHEAPCPMLIIPVHGSGI